MTPAFKFHEYSAYAFRFNKGGTLTELPSPQAKERENSPSLIALKEVQ